MRRASAAALLTPAFLFIGGCNGSHSHKQALVQPPAKLPPSVRTRPGAKLFQQLPCLNCHTYRGAGSSNLGAPDLSAEGRKHRAIRWLIRYMACPRCVNLASPMPAFSGLPKRDLRKLAVFLEASK